MSAVLNIEALEAEARTLVVDVIKKQVTAKKWFDVTALNNLDRFFDSEAETCARCTREFKVLRALHCIEFTEMPADLRNAIPALVDTVIEAARGNFEQRQAAKVAA